MGKDDIYYLGSSLIDEVFTLGSAAEIFYSTNADELRNAEQIEIYALLNVKEENGFELKIPAKIPLDKEILVEFDSDDVRDLEAYCQGSDSLMADKDLGDVNKQNIKDFIQKKIVKYIRDDMEAEQIGELWKIKASTVKKYGSSIRSNIRNDVESNFASLIKDISDPLGKHYLDISFSPYDSIGVLVVPLKITGYQMYEVKLKGFRATQDIKYLVSKELKDIIANMLASEMQQKKQLFLDIVKQTSLYYSLASHGINVNLDQFPFRLEAKDEDGSLLVSYSLDSNKTQNTISIKGFKLPDNVEIRNIFADFVGASLLKAPPMSDSEEKVLAWAESAEASRKPGTPAMTFCFDTCEGNSVIYKVYKYTANENFSFQQSESKNASVIITRLEDERLNFDLRDGSNRKGTLLRKNGELFLEDTDGHAQKKQRLVLVDKNIS